MKKAVLIGLGPLIIFSWIFFSKTEAPNFGEKKKPFPVKVDWNKTTTEAKELLKQLIRIKTIRGNETEAAKVIQEFLKKEGITAQIIAKPGHSQRGNLYAVLPGQENAKGIILSNHLDTVEANTKQWQYNPFQGNEVANRIYGRGALDMKGMAVIELMAFVLFKRLQIPLKNNLMFLSVADEESGGKLGSKFLIQQKPELFKGYGYVLNEGGVGTYNVAIKEATFLNIQFADKGILWLQAEAKGPASHGSLPSSDYAAVRLMQFINQVRNKFSKLEISETTTPFFFQLGQAVSFPKSFFLQRSNNALIQLLLRPTIRKNKHLSAMTHNTVSLTYFNTGSSKSHNVIAGKASAFLDIRLLPNHDYKQVLEEIKVMAKRLNISLRMVDGFNATVSTKNSAYFQSLASAAAKYYPQATLTPMLSPGFSDSTFYRQFGLECYGLIPVVLDKSGLAGFHGHDEYMPVGGLQKAIQVVFESILTYNTN